MKTGSIFGFGTAFTVIHLSLWPVLAQNGPVASSVGILQSAVRCSFGVDHDLNLLTSII